MTDQSVLEPTASREEMHLAKVAHQCLVAALDHSRADALQVRLEDDQHASSPSIRVPPRALRLLAEILRLMAQGDPVVLMPQKHEMTTQEAANFLNVSRPFIVRELERGRLAYRKVGSHRRIEFMELLRYKQEQQATSKAALQRLTELSDELGLEF